MNDPERNLSWGEQLGLVVTNLTKLAGVVLAFIEAAGEARPGVMAFCTVCVAGAQAVENIIRGVFGK